LKILADISGQADKARIQEVLAITGLEKDSHQRVRNFSVGMRKRLGIAQAILEQPELLLLDEPTDSIDESGWQAIYEYLLELKDKGTAILLTSNKFDEINILCDQAFMLERTGLNALPIQ
jgi:ABC-2 type transport system ATP-binding protein